MRDGFLAAILLGLLLVAPPLAGEEDREPYALVIHGGAGTLRPEDFTGVLRNRYRAELRKALGVGIEILAKGGTSLDAVEATVRVLEDSELFNAGKGAVFTHEERNELDAAIMDGSTLRAGAVAGLTTVRNPISAARAVMEETKHVMLVGPGADRFAASVGLEIVEPDYFFTQRRWDALQQSKADERQAQGQVGQQAVDPYARGMGTVGALALDQAGRLAAATSTGGTTNKRWGRVGDSPIIGAGTYADRDCAVSATGTGEYFMRHAVAHDICARARYLELSVGEAAREVVFQVLEPGIGGVITLDSQGNVAMPFNTQGMYRGYILGSGESRVEIFKD